MDALEKVYLAGFPLLLVFVSAFPLFQRQPSVNSASTAKGDVCCNGSFKPFLHGSPTRNKCDGRVSNGVLAINGYEHLLRGRFGLEFPATRVYLSA